ncbi:U32 family peptidase [Methanolacinia paynteri]|uniref:U32 family peptidase n=1 Tax=Methanolacinia paynteri TaxID=230356 RepID=UPI00064EABE7|nr:U32 family peptidase [Methanolacinia paynteri]
MGEKKIPELLAPAGSFESLKAAVSAGADAVYLGGRKFGARNLASNFTGEELKDAVDYCHSRNVRVYVTHNILVHDDEIADSINELHFLFSIGVDAVLLQDFGILHEASKILPDLELHASTQMTIHNPEGVLWAEANGVSRVVLSREMSLEDISAVRNFKGTEKTGLEVFVHGALCCSYSGQCLLSSMIGGRSGNRGLCAQPCRKEYGILSLEFDGCGNPAIKKKNGSCYMMSPADLCAYRNLDSLAVSGVDSLKIEGRMKSPEYVAIVVSVYRRALDLIAKGGWSSSDEDETLLLLAFNRNFTGGYISGESGVSIMSIDRPGNRGVYAGRVIGYDRGKKKVTVRADERIVPEAGDGILIRQPGTQDDFGLTIPGNAEKKGREISFHVKNPAVPGSSAYITKSVLLSKMAKEISSSPGGVAKKIPVRLRIYFDGKVPVASAVFPSLHGELSYETRAGFEMQDAKSRPVEPDDLRNIFCKTGNLQFEVADYKSDYPGGLFAPVSLLNEFRRDLFDGIEKRLIDVCLPSDDKIAGSAEGRDLFLSTLTNRKAVMPPRQAGRTISVYVSSLASAKTALDAGCTRVYYEMKTVPGIDSSVYAREFEEGISAASEYGADFVWKWPRITDRSFFRTAEEILESLGDSKPDGIMVENVGDGVAAMRIAKDIPLYGGQGLNIFNHLAVGMFSGDYRLLTLSCELNRSQLKRLCGLSGANISSRPLLEYVVFGPSEILISENNLPAASVGNNYSPSEEYGIADNTGRIFPVQVDAYGRTHVYNSAVTCLIDSLPEIFATGVDGISLDLRLNSPEFAGKITGLYVKAATLSLDAGKKSSGSLNLLKKEITSLYRGEITAGHFNRGV